MSKVQAVRLRNVEESWGLLLEQQTTIVSCATHQVHYEPGLGVGVPIPKGAELLDSSITPYEVLDASFIKQHPVEFMTMYLHAKLSVPKWLSQAYWKTLGFTIAQTPVEIDVKYGKLINKVCQGFKMTTVMETINNQHEAQARLTTGRNWVNNQKFIQKGKRHWPAPFRKRFPRAEKGTELRTLLTNYPIFCGLRPDEICDNLNQIMYLVSVASISRHLEDTWAQLNV